MRAEIAKVVMVAMASLLLSCETRSSGVEPMRVIASIGGNALRVSDLEGALPQGLNAQDSAQFVALYAKRWIMNELKQSEAERIFSSSSRDVEDMVRRYRSSLLCRKLDQFYINNAAPPQISEEQITRYYNLNYSEFPLEYNIVKGRILRIPNDHAALKSLSDLMRSNLTERSRDLASLCERDNSLMLTEYEQEWVKYIDFVEMLPLVHDEVGDKYLKRNGVQSLTSEEYLYLFEVTAYRSQGKAAPLEIARDMIQRILTNEALTKLIHDHEERLLESAQERGLIRDYTTIENEI